MVKYININSKMMNAFEVILRYKWKNLVHNIWIHDVKSAEATLTPPVLSQGPAVTSLSSDRPSPHREEGPS